MQQFTDVLKGIHTHGQKEDKQLLKFEFSLTRRAAIMAAALAIIISYFAYALSPFSPKSEDNLLDNGSFEMLCIGDKEKMIANGIFRFIPDHDGVRYIPYGFSLNLYDGWSGEGDVFEIFQRNDDGKLNTAIHVKTNVLSAIRADKSIKRLDGKFVFAVECRGTVGSQIGFSLYTLRNGKHLYQVPIQYDPQQVLNVGKDWKRYQCQVTCADSRVKEVVPVVLVKGDVVLDNVTFLYR